MSLLVTILTPTYNRAKNLMVLYNSLCNQSNLNFQWLIIDDGSEDDTKTVINSFKKDFFPIIYLKKDNGGKHTAINYGLQYIETKYTFIVDSDDQLKNDAIATIEKYDMLYSNITDICGFSFLRQNTSGKINVSTGSNVDFIDSYNNVRILQNRQGDMAEVFLSKILRDYPFPIYEKEKFMSEDVVWLEIGKKFKLVFSPVPIYISEYLPGGLTNNRRKNTILSCHGSFLRSERFLTVKLPKLLMIKIIMQLIVFGKFCGYKNGYIRKQCKYKFLYLLLYIPSIVVYLKWKKKYLA